MRRRQGLSLTELLVVIAIIATLFGLLLPAIQKVRSAAALTICSNNLKQIGLALQSYHGVNQRFPPGVTSNLPHEPFPRTTWLARILPYVEQEPLWMQSQSAYTTSTDPFTNPPHVGLAFPVTFFGCPLDDRTGLAHETHNNRRVALTSYVGVMGTNWSLKDGVLFLDSSVSVKAITDGISSTIMVGERPASADNWYGWWYAGVGQMGSGSPDMLLGTRELNIADKYTYFCAPGPYDFQNGDFGNQCDVFHFWSPHSGGANFLFADGSVRFLSYGVNSIMPALGTRAGREIVEIP